MQLCHDNAGKDARAYRSRTGQRSLHAVLPTTALHRHTEHPCVASKPGRARYVWMHCSRLPQRGLLGSSPLSDSLLCPAHALRVPAQATPCPPRRPRAGPPEPPVQGNTSNAHGPRVRAFAPCQGSPGPKQQCKRCCCRRHGTHAADSTPHTCSVAPSERERQEVQDNQKGTAMAPHLCWP